VAAALRPVIARLGVGRIERQGLPVVSGRLLITSQHLQRVTEIVVCLRVSWPKRQRLSYLSVAIAALLSPHPNFNVSTRCRVSVL
jgi:hypothetical protein